jgi:two-component system chemotaxis response regulator CheB
MAVRDIIAIGASAGGFEAMQMLAAELPSDLRAAIFVTLHQFPRADGILPAVLNRSGPVPAKHAEDGEPIEMGRIYVAPPDYHLVLQNGFIQLSHGPKENMNRPCINVMFRSAATSYRDFIR